MKINYNKIADKYNIFHQLPKKYFNLQVLKFLNLLEINKNSNILDVGCGAGRLLFPISKKSKNIIGIEKSIDMYSEILKNKKDEKIKILNMDFNDFLKNNLKIFDAIYFSMSLHQMGNKNKQIQILKKSLNFLKQNKYLLLISISNQQFNKNILNRYFPTLDQIDRKRFLQIEDLEKNFYIENYEQQDIILNYEKLIFINMLKNKYISSLQLIPNDEIKKGINKINIDFDKIVNYFDSYTYILIKNV